LEPKKNPQPLSQESLVNNDEKISNNTNNTSNNDEKISNNTSNNDSNIPLGTKISNINGQLLISSGLHDIDYILCDGFPVGTMVLVEEDQFSTIYNVLMKYFVAEGLMNNQTMVLSSHDGDLSRWVTKLPFVTENEENDGKKSNDDSNLRISWQYEKYSKLYQETKREKWCHSFDLVKNIQSKYIENVDIESIDFGDDESNFNLKCKKLYNSINEKVNKINKEISVSKKPKIFRIAIKSFGSHIWGVSKDKDKSMYKFLHALRGLMHYSLGVCLVTIPTYQFNSSVAKKIEHLFDFVFELESFTEPEKINDLFKDFDGLFHIKKVPTINSLVSLPLPQGNTYTYQVKRKKLFIEAIHLQPEISRGMGEKKRRQETEIIQCALPTKPN